MPLRGNGLPWLQTETAAEQSDEPVEALELKMVYDGPGFINVRFAGYRWCSADSGAKPRTSWGQDGGTILSMASSQTTRDRILDALQDLPGDATFDDAIERLVFLAKVDAGLAELDEGKGIPHEEAKRRLGL
jgi:predicted transcriptional regulator